MRAWAAAFFVLGILASATAAPAQDNQLPVIKKLNGIQIQRAETPGDAADELPCSGRGERVNEACVCEPGYTGAACERKAKKKVAPSGLENVQKLDSPLPRNAPEISQCTIDMRKLQIANKRKDEEIASLRKALAKATQPGCIDKRFLRTGGGELVDCWDSGYNCFDGRCDTGCNNSTWCAPNFVCETVPRPGKCVLPKALRMQEYCSDVTEDDL